MNKQKQTAKSLAWMQILLGILFLSSAAYKLISHGYHWEKVNIGLTVIFGIVLPLIAVFHLVRIRKEEQKENGNSLKEF